MKIFVIGGSSHSEDSPERDADVCELDRLMMFFAEQLEKSGHEVITCSPFPGTADRALLNALMNDRFSRRRPRVELHFPSTQHTLTEVEKALEGTPDDWVLLFKHPAPADELPASLANAWLFSQLYALERSHAVLAIGGKLGGTTNLLLHLAEAKHKPVLAIPSLGGASEQCYWRRKYELEDRLGDAASQLSAKNSTHQWTSLIEQLTDQNSRNVVNHKNSAPTFFISYPRARPQEADVVEMLLRRRNLSVYRDDQDFEPGNLIEADIANHIHRASVFIALYSQDYACSPWCYDELRIATSLHSNTKIKLWLLTLDNTRIVLPEARNIVTLPARSRSELEGKLNQQLDRLIEL